MGQLLALLMGRVMVLMMAPTMAPETVEVMA
jgi:hypothetical protein